MKYHWNPASISGDGYAVAYRAGAELANMDLTGWGLRIRDDLTISYGNFDHGDGIRAKWYTADGVEIPYPTADKYREIELAGKDPIYVTQDHLTEDYHKRMQTAFVDEKMISFKIAQDRKFNPRTHRYELMENHPLNFMVPTGINVDENFKSVNMDGLYAIGDCSAGAHGCGNAAAGGLLVAENLKNGLGNVNQGTINEEQVMKHHNDLFAHMKPNRKSFKPLAKPMELELSTRYIAGRYVGQAKSG
jgi:succinate dehydrogenase/fumarate reductase flavoprotein subunit